MEKQGYVIRLSEKETDFLEGIAQREDVSEKTKTRARILLACHEKGCGQKTRLSEIADALGVSRTTVQNVRADFKEGGFEYALYNKKAHSSTSASQKRINALGEKIKSMVRELPPEGKSRWTVRLIASECVKRGYAEHASPSYVLKVLRKCNIMP